MFGDLNPTVRCLSVSVINDVLVEATEDFFVCASSEQAIELIPTCASVLISDNDGE